MAPDSETAVACNPGSGDITLIDVPQKKAVHTMLTGNGAMRAVFSPDGKYAYVANAGNGDVSVVDIKQRQEVQTIPAGKGVMAFEPTKNWRTAWVTGPDPDMIAISPDGKNLYLTSRDDNKLLGLSAADLSVKTELATGDEPHGVACRK